MHKPVDNCTQLRITTAVLWTAKMLSINLFRPLAPRVGGGVEMLHRRKRHRPWGKLRGRGRRRETGTSCGCAALAVGRRSRAGQETGHRGMAGRARPPPSHTWRGPCLIVPERNTSATRDTPAKLSNAGNCAGLLWTAVTRDGASTNVPRDARGWAAVGVRCGSGTNEQQLLRAGLPNVAAMP